ncbi:hypothetical protein HN51_021588, partial [Arachis hypogaea]
ANNDNKAAGIEKSSRRSPSEDAANVRSQSEELITNAVEVSKGLGLHSIDDNKLMGQNEREGYGDTEDHLEEERQGNDVEDKGNECESLDDQILENQKTWELAKES